MGIHRSYKNFVPPMWGRSSTTGDHRLDIPLGPAAGRGGDGLRHRSRRLRNFSLQLPFVLRKSRGRSLAIDLFHPGFRQVLRLMGPAVVSLSIYQVNSIISQNLASAWRREAPRP